MPQERILIAEDEADLRKICALILKRAGYDPVAVEDGQQAVERARQESFDLLLTDIKMPRLSGLDACRAIRSLNPDLPIVIMTGYGTIESAIDAVRLGVSEFLLKPFRPDDLEAAVGRALAKKRLEQENARLKALIPLFDLSRILMRAVDLEAAPKQIVHIAYKELQADSASLMLLGPKGELTIHSSEGLSDQALAVMRQRVSEGYAGLVTKQRGPLILQNGDEEERRAEATYGVKHLTSAVSLPLIHQERVLGVLNVAKTRASPPFTQVDIDFLSLLASQAAIALDNARLFQEIQRAYQRLAELDHLKSEFISIAAHELRSPLAVVLAYAALLEEQAAGPTRELLSQVVQAAMQLKSIIDEMVSLRHIDTGEAQVTFSEVHLAQALNTVLADVRPHAESKAQSLSVNLPTDLPAVRADPQVLQLILSNLLSNAIKFTPEKGQIRISAKVEDRQVVMAISDTGVGIPPEDLERIFQRFYQVESSLRRKHGGIGLGLAIAREMTELLDGRLWAESQAGQGATFYLSLAQA